MERNFDFFLFFLKAFKKTQKKEPPSLPVFHPLRLRDWSSLFFFWLVGWCGVVDVVGWMDGWMDGGNVI
jgi:hypothetical protein